MNALVAVEEAPQGAFLETGDGTACEEDDQQHTEGNGHFVLRWVLLMSGLRIRRDGFSFSRQCKGLVVSGTPKRTVD